MSINDLENSIIPTIEINSATDLFTLKNEYDDKYCEWVAPPEYLTVKGNSLNSYFNVGTAGVVSVKRYSKWMISIIYCGVGIFISAYTNYRDTTITFLKSFSGGQQSVVISST